LSDIKSAVTLTLGMEADQASGANAGNVLADSALKAFVQVFSGSELQEALSKALGKAISDITPGLKQVAQQAVGSSAVMQQAGVDQQGRLLNGGGAEEGPASWNKNNPANVASFSRSFGEEYRGQLRHVDYSAEAGGATARALTAMRRAGAATTATPEELATMRAGIPAGEKLLAMERQEQQDKAAHIAAEVDRRDKVMDQMGMAGDLKSYQSLKSELDEVCSSLSKLRRESDELSEQQSRHSRTLEETKNTVKESDAYGGIGRANMAGLVGGAGVALGFAGSFPNILRRNRAASAGIEDFGGRSIDDISGVAAGYLSGADTEEGKSNARLQALASGGWKILGGITGLMGSGFTGGVSGVAGAGFLASGVSDLSNLSQGTLENLQTQRSSYQEKNKEFFDANLVGNQAMAEAFETARSSGNPALAASMMGNPSLANYAQNQGYLSSSQYQQILQGTTAGVGGNGLDGAAQKRAIQLGSLGVDISGIAGGLTTGGSSDVTGDTAQMYKRLAASGVDKTLIPGILSSMGQQASVGLGSAGAATSWTSATAAATSQMFPGGASRAESERIQDTASGVRGASGGLAGVAAWSTVNKLDEQMGKHLSFSQKATLYSEIQHGGITDGTLESFGIKPEDAKKYQKSTPGIYAGSIVDVAGKYSKDQAGRELVESSIIGRQTGMPGTEKELLALSAGGTSGNATSSDLQSQIDQLGKAAGAGSKDILSASDWTKFNTGLDLAGKSLEEFKGYIEAANAAFASNAKKQSVDIPAQRAAEAQAAHDSAVRMQRRADNPLGHGGRALAQ
jgi:hypothetical protein